LRALSSATEAIRRSELRRMRALATGLLAAMTAIFIATRFAPAAWTWAGYVAAFAEAAMVGACADWFAVTALFRRPFGLPIPHTAIIPRNKARIGQALGDFIGGEFLTPRVFDAKLREFGPARRLADWLIAPGNVGALAPRLAALAPDIAPSGPAVRSFVGDLVRRLANAGPAAPLLARLLGYVWRDPAARRLIDRAIGVLADFMASREASIQSQVTGRAWKWLPKFVDDILAERITKGLLGAVQELRDPDHPWRIEIDAAIDRFIDDLSNDPVLIARVEALKARLLTDPTVRDHLRALWSELGSRLAADPDLAEHAIARALTALGRWLDADVKSRDRLDGWLRVATRRVLSPRRQAIGAFVAQVVAGWDAREVVDKLELQVGRDLQYIRINGTVVGGLVGLAIYAVSRVL
jgi:uncharacterized membrane-anchored protein YjiN (DUF445 family)